MLTNAGVENGDPTAGFCLLDLDASWLTSRGLPVCPYPVPIKAMDTVLASGGQVLPAQLLVWMQEYVEDDQAPWREYLAPMRQLAKRNTPNDRRQVIPIQGERWALVCGPVDLDCALVSFCRQGELLATAQKHSTGCLQVCCYQALDARTCRLILSASLKPAADGTVCMRPNNWEYLFDGSGTTGQFYACESGSSYMAPWLSGFGIRGKKEIDPVWHPKRTAEPFPAAVLAHILGDYGALASDSPY